MNVGKIFEESIKNSIPSWCIYYRLKDPPQSFNKSSSLRFSWKNPCDMFLFDTKNCKFMAIELKTTDGTSFSFENINEDKPKNAMIHKHQILGLKEYGEFDNTICGFLFNFRIKKENKERTFFMNIFDFIELTNKIDKKSINLKDVENNSIELIGMKKRIKYTWSICELINKLNKE